MNLIKKLQTTSGDDFQIVRQIKMEHYKTKLSSNRCKAVSQASSNNIKKFEGKRDRSCRLVDNIVTPIPDPPKPPAPNPAQ